MTIRRHIYDEVLDCRYDSMRRHYPPRREMEDAQGYELPLAPLSIVEPLSRAILDGAVVMLPAASVGRYKAACSAPAFAALDLQGGVLHAWDCAYEAATWAAKHHPAEAQAWLGRQGLGPAPVPAEAVERIHAALLDFVPESLGEALVKLGAGSILTAEAAGRVLPFDAACRISLAFNRPLSWLKVGRVRLMCVRSKASVAWGIVEGPCEGERDPARIARLLCAEVLHGPQDHAQRLGAMQAHNAAHKPALASARSLGTITTQDMPARPTARPNPWLHPQPRAGPNPPRQRARIAMKHAKPRTRRKTPPSSHGAALVSHVRAHPAPHPMPSIQGPRPFDVEAITARHVTVIERDPDGNASLRRLTSAQYMDKLDDPRFDPLTDLADLDADGLPIHPDDLSDLADMSDDGASLPAFDAARLMELGDRLDGLNAEREAATYEASVRALEAMEGKARTSAPLPDDHPRHKPLPRVQDEEQGDDVDDIAADILTHPWVIPAFDAPFDPEQEDPRLLWFLRHNRDAIGDFHARLRLRWELLTASTSRMRSFTAAEWTMELTCAMIQRSAWLPLPLAWHLSPRNMQFVGPLLAPIHNRAVERGRAPMEVRHDTLKGRREDIIEVCQIFQRLQGEISRTPQDLAPVRLVAALGPGEAIPRGVEWKDAPDPGDLLLLWLD